jgi:primosomal protein N' (replication factor Y)
MKVSTECAACGSHLLNYKGFGTEKIEEELETLFLSARIGRLDLDAAKSKHGHEKIIQDFKTISLIFWWEPKCLAKV